MKALRERRFFALWLVFSLVGFAPAHADVRLLERDLRLPQPTSPSYDVFGIDVAIDGGHIIVLAINDGEGSNDYAALLYRRNGNGDWVYRRTLVEVNGAFARTSVAMKNGLAVVNFGGQVFLFEFANGDYMPAPSAAPVSHPGGVAISAKRVLIGGDGCDYDAVVYEKGANGVWDITGRMDDNAGTDCDVWGMEVELNYDYALLRPHSAGVATAWRRNGSALDWIPAGTLNVPPGVGHSNEPYALQGATAVGNNGYVWRRTASGDWELQGKARSVDHDSSFGITFNAVFRDGVLVTSESTRSGASPRVYLEASPGRFEHVESLRVSDNTHTLDVSGRTVAVVTRQPIASEWNVEMFTLPEELGPPDPIVNDFEDHDGSGFSFHRGQFALATRGSDDVLEQGSSASMAIALVDGSDSPLYQRIEAEITPTFGVPGSWAGLVARYVDSDNFYFAVLRAGDAFALYKRVNGVNTLLREGVLYQPPASPRLALVANDDLVELRFGNNNYVAAPDPSLARGRAGVATYRAMADFDDIHVAAASEYPLFFRDWSYFGSDFDLDMTTAGGDWDLQQDEFGANLGMSQLDVSGSAVAYIGTPVDNQEVFARMRLDEFGASQQGAWFGLLARYVDANNHYYVTARSTGQIQIRKIVNGAITVLASASFTPAPGEYHELRFRVVDDQLHLFVDDVLVATAHDTDIAEGQYGMATYRSAMTVETISALQP